MSLPSDRGRETSSVHDDYTIFEMEKKDINKRVLYADKIDRATFDSMLESTKKEIKAKREAVEAALKTVASRLIVPISLITELSISEFANSSSYFISIIVIYNSLKN